MISKVWFWEGGKGGRDFSFSMAQALEKCRDRFDAGCIAIGDIKTFHDALPWGRLLQGCLRRRIDPHVCRALLRLHRCPVVSLRVGPYFTHVIQRTRGALTGASSASLAARVIVEDSLAMARSSFVDVFEVRGSGRETIDAMAWSDNLAVIASSNTAASSNLAAWRHFLRLEFKCDLKPDSLELIPSRCKAMGETREVESGLSWVVRDKTKCLGSWLSGTGEDRSERQALMNAWNAAFWSNVRIFTNSRASIKSRFRIWKKLAFSIAEHHWVAIRPSLTSDSELEAYFNKFLHRIVRLRRLSDEETAEAFAIRRNTATARLKEELKINVKFQHALKLVTWVEHLYRHKSSPSFSLLTSQDDAWLETCRCLVANFSSSRTAFAGATGTRSGAGFPRRWGGGWLASVSAELGGWENPRKDKAISKGRASFLVQHFMSRPTARLALMDA